ncbi:MAG: FAD-binding protein [Anaerolineales bacterium]
MTAAAERALPLERLARLENFGHSLRAPAYLYQPERVEQLGDLLELARRQNLSVALRGSGRSYGDAALNSGQIVIDQRRLNRVQEWDPETGVIRVEPGVTIEQLWKHVLPHGWWPPVVPGTMLPTLGGCLAANIHGKNNWQAGTLGEHALEFEALLPNGQTTRCTPDENSEMFYSMIGGMGLLGLFTSIKLQLKKIASGNMNVTAWTEGSIQTMLTAVDEHKESDYVVGWVDCLAGGKRLGRGQIHSARYLKNGESQDEQRTLRVEHQVLPDRYFGILPKKCLPKLIAPFTNNFGTWGVNTVKYTANATLGNHKTYRQSLVSFNFLLDYIPGWERSYGRGGLIQYQSFIPKELARDGYAEILRLCKDRGLPSYLGVLKRHRPDKFLLSHAVDGFSLALDFPVTDANRKRLKELTSEMDEIVLNAGGRFYFAKDSTLNAEKVRRYLGDDTVKKFRELKNSVDPDNILQSDLYRRCFDG